MSSYTPKHLGPIHAATDPDGRHFLEGALDPRLRVAPFDAQPTSDSGPDIVLVRAVLPAMIVEGLQKVPKAMLDRVAAGDAILILDASGEGPAYSHSTASVAHKALRAAGVPGGRTVYLTQNRDWEVAYRGFCYANVGLEPMHVLHYDFYIRNFFRDHEADGEQTFQARLAAFQRRAAVREKRFVCLNFSARPSKVLLLLKLIEAGLYDQGFISFPGFDKTRNERAVKRTLMILDVAATPGLEDVAAGLLPYFDALGGKDDAVFGPLDMQAARADQYRSLSGDMALDEYNRSWFTVITESEFQGSRRITEKPFKPLANFSPYINFGNRGALELVRDFGFRTFGAVIDEAYDAERDPRRRFAMVFDEIQRLCALPDAALRDLEMALAETLTHNARHALTTMPGVYRDDLEPRLVDRLMDIRLQP